MKSLLFKEIGGFFSSVTGYVVISVFLIINGLFLWVFPGERNVLDAGYANLDTLFNIAPWVFLFLVPAITMRSFADEQKSGNMELLFTRPISELKIVMAKYFAGLVVALLALLPTLFYLIILRNLGTPKADIDYGATWGSYIGLLFLASAYTGIGIFASSLTENTIIAFILAVALSFFLYMGFNSVAYLSLSGKIGNFILSLGIDAHYNSMRRGIIDSRDLVYFLSIITLFLALTKLRLKGKSW